MPFRGADRLLKGLGITEPDEIDLEAIAYSVGVRICYRPLDGCEACIVGNDIEGIISVSTKSSVQRQRFSIAHELGHWELHRGQKLVCRLEGQKSTFITERGANSYAADLLMPRYLFNPLLEQHKMANLKVIHILSETFKTSLTATAIRLIESDKFPALLVCHSQQKRNWFIKAPSLPDYWWPKDLLDASSSALDVLYNRRQEDSNPRKINAEAWFDCREARGKEFYEQTMRIGEGEILTFLTLNAR